MTERIVKGGAKAATRLACLYWTTSAQAPLHYAPCTAGTCATVLAMVAALGCRGMGQIVRS